METSEVLELFASPLEESWSEQYTLVSYRGGMAIVTEESFDFRDNPPRLENTEIGYDTPNGIYYFHREASNHRALYTYQVKVYQNGHPITVDVLEKAQKMLNTIRLALRQLMVNSW